MKDKELRNVLIDGRVILAVPDSYGGIAPSSRVVYLERRVNNLDEVIRAILDHFDLEEVTLPAEPSKIILRKRKKGK